MQVIQGNKKPKPDYGKIYQRIFMEKVNNAIDAHSDVRSKQIVYYGIKYINSIDEDSSVDIDINFNIICLVKSVIASFTPRELMEIFPANKEYNGPKYGTKDYFSTMQAINNIGIDNKISGNVDDFLIDYNCCHTREFCVKEWCLLSKMRKMEGKKSLAEEFIDFAESQGKHITTYTEITGNNGKKVMINNDTGKSFNVKKKMPKYLKVIN